ncbi:MAG: DUF1491 family protein [Rhodospirillaceae bacterium]
MSEARLKTDFWIGAQIRLCDLAFIPAVVARRGDSDAGQVLIRRDRRDGTCELFARTRTLDGATAWRRMTGPEPVAHPVADEMVAREAKFDPDLWVLEIEDPGDRYRFDAPVV